MKERKERNQDTERINILENILGMFIFYFTMKEYLEYCNKDYMKRGATVSDDQSTEKRQKVEIHLNSLFDKHSLLQQIYITGFARTVTPQQLSLSVFWGVPKLGILVVDVSDAFFCWLVF